MAGPIAGSGLSGDHHRRDRAQVREGSVANRPVYVAMGVNLDGMRDLLGMWVGPSTFPRRTEHGSPKQSASCGSTPSGGELVEPASLHRSKMAIATRWGYGDPAHFTRSFRARFGVTPAALRRRAKGTLSA